jgi:hypothetical protein
MYVIAPFSRESSKALCASVKFVEVYNFQRRKQQSRFSALTPILQGAFMGVLANYNNSGNICQR